MTSWLVPLCAASIALYVLVGVVASWQLVKIIVSSSATNEFSCTLPLTTQQRVHIMGIIICVGKFTCMIDLNWELHISLTARVGFFIAAGFGWDQSEGELNSRQTSFAVFEEIAMLAFLTIFSMVSLFWAELYYIAIDEPNVRAFMLLCTHQTYLTPPKVYASLIRPIVVLINVAAYTGLFTYWIFFPSDSASSDTYVTSRYGLYVCLYYGSMAVICASYSRLAAQQLRYPTHPFAFSFYQLHLCKYSLADLCRWNSTFAEERSENSPHWRLCV